MKIKNILVGQSGGPTVAINASLAGVIKQGISKNMKVYGAINGIEGVIDNKIILLNDIITENELHLLKQTPDMALGSCRYKLDTSDLNTFQKILDTLYKYDIGYFFYIGGNDSMDTVDKIHNYIKSLELEINVIGIPKTIDNDLVITNHTPGFGSAAKFLITSINEIICDIEIYNTKSVTIIEVMGRNSGWLTLAAAIPKFLYGEKPDIVCIPEVPFCKYRFVDQINKHFKNNNFNILVVISEGIKDEYGNYISEQGKLKAKDEFGHPMLSGAAKYLEQYVKEKIGCKTRSIELNIPQRSAGHLQSMKDIDLSYEIGLEAVNIAVSGKSGVAMIFEKINGQSKYNINTCDIHKIANYEKLVPKEWHNIEDKFVQKEIIDYILPLTKGNVDFQMDKFGFIKYFKINNYISNI